MRGEMLATWMTLTKDSPSPSLHFSVPRRQEAVGRGKRTQGYGKPTEEIDNLNVRF